VKTLRFPSGLLIHRRIPARRRSVPGVGLHAHILCHPRTPCTHRPQLGLYRLPLDEAPPPAK
jgi:hypothetical protein